MHSFITQLFGFLAMGAFLASYQTKSNRPLFFWQIIGILCFITQYYLLGAITGCMSLCICLLRNIMLYHRSQWTWVQWKGWVPIIISLLFLVMVFNWNGIQSLFSFIAPTIGTICYWQNNAGKIRLGNLFGVSPCWLIYDCFSGSIGGICNEIFCITSILISVWRFGWKALLDPDSDFQK